MLDLDALVLALLEEDDATVPCGLHPADLVAAAIGERLLRGHLAIELAA